jgi:hypothetical protein
MIAMAEGVCLGVVSTAIRFGASMGQSYRFCPPSDAAPKDIIPVMIDIVSKNPQLQDADVRDLANYAGRTRWPCR